MYMTGSVQITPKEFKANSELFQTFEDFFKSDLWYKIRRDMSFYAQEKGEALRAAPGGDAGGTRAPAQHRGRPSSKPRPRSTSKAPASKHDA